MLVLSASITGEHLYYRSIARDTYPYINTDPTTAMEAELQTYLDQIAYVNLQLESDPTNDELLKLKVELDEIVDLTREAIAQTSTSKSQAAAEKNKDKGKAKETNPNWQDNGAYKAGMDCMSKYKDGKWYVQSESPVVQDRDTDSRYPARISAVVGSKETPLYTITFKGYSSSTNVPLSSLRPHDPNAPIPQPVQKRKVEEPTEREKEKKKAKGEKWMEKQQARADEAKGKQSAWAKFGKKAQKKGIHIAGLEGKSVFKTSDSVTGRG